MKLLLVIVIATVLGLEGPVLPYTIEYTLSYDTVYDHGQNSLNLVACSSGEYGLITAGFTTFDSLPTFPHIGGAPQIASWNSRYCGTCWELTHTDAQGHSQSLNITAMDTGDGTLEGFSLSLESMNYLTDSQAVSLGRTQISAKRIPKSVCGL